jgi:hypothetical protein
MAQQRQAVCSSVAAGMTNDPKGIVIRMHANLLITNV